MKRWLLGLAAAAIGCSGAPAARPTALVRVAAPLAARWGIAAIDEDNKRVRILTDQGELRADFRPCAGLAVERVRTSTTHALLAFNCIDDDHNVLSVVVAELGPKIVLRTLLRGDYPVVDLPPDGRTLVVRLGSGSGYLASFDLWTGRETGRLCCTESAVRGPEGSYFGLDTTDWKHPILMELRPGMPEREVAHWKQPSWIWTSESGRATYIFHARPDDKSQEVLRMVPPGAPTPFVTLSSGESVAGVLEDGLLIRRRTGCMVRPGCQPSGPATPPPCDQEASALEDIIQVAPDGNQKIWMRGSAPFGGLLMRPDGAAALVALFDQGGLTAWQLVMPGRTPTMVPTPNPYASWLWVRLPAP